MSFPLSDSPFPQVVLACPPYRFSFIQGSSADVIQLPGMTAWGGVFQGAGRSVLSSHFLLLTFLNFDNQNFQRFENFIFLLVDCVLGYPLNLGQLAFRFSFGSKV